MTRADLALALAEQLGDRVHVAEDIVDGTHGLRESELAAIAHAVPKRQAEFAAGRRAARAALVAIGQGEAAIPADADRAPIWPDGVIGSITHDQGLALAVVSETREVYALGVDLTEAAPLPGEVRRAILRSEEETALDELDARAAFAIKECVFKALHPSVKKFFGFDAAIARPRIREGSFSAELTLEVGPYERGTIFEGVLLSERGRLVSALILRC